MRWAHDQREVEILAGRRDPGAVETASAFRLLFGEDGGAVGSASLGLASERRPWWSRCS